MNYFKKYVLVDKRLHVVKLVLLMLFVFLFNIDAVEPTQPVVFSKTQQGITVTGTITDEIGEPLSGVNISVKGTTTGVISDADGRYSIVVPNKNAVLVYSYIGYTTNETVVGNQTMINLSMEEDTLEMDEIVVIGYGVVRKSDLTGSVSSVTTKQIQDQPITSLDQALNGRVPGVMIISNSGAPDQNIQVRIRGANSIYGGNDPLYVVDGVPNSTLFNNLDPNDIQSIEVLKDASATAIYGSRGANGVVLVTTKRGAEGKSRIVFETQQSWNTLANKMDMAGAADYARFINQYRGFDFFSASEINNWDANGGTDWQDLIFRTAHTQNYKLSIMGGTPKLKYLISGNMLDNQGLLLDSESQRYNIRSNISTDVNNWLGVNLDINALRRRNSKIGPRGGIGGVISDALTTSPTMELKNSEGNWNRDQLSSIQINPYGRLIQDMNESITNYVTANLQLNIKLPVKGLTLDLQGSANFNDQKSRNMNSNALNLGRTSNSANNRANDGFTWYNLNQLNYTNQWGDHRITALASLEFTETTSTNMVFEVVNLSMESVEFWNLNLGSMNSYSNEYSKSSLASVIGRAMYQYKDRYLFTATFRRDGSSRFQNNKWSNFPSLAVAWRASEEPFIKNLNIFDMLKVRGSWGMTGNQGIGVYSTLGLLSSANYSWASTTNQAGYRIGNPSTPDLTWEKTAQWDIGLDAGFFKNRLTVTLDLFTKLTTDLLLQKSIPNYDGGGSTWMNLGEVRNKGVEFAMTVVPLSSKNLTWESMFNVSYSKNEVVDLGGEQQLHPGTRINQASLNTAVLRVGSPLGSIYGYQWEGLWRTGEAEEAAKWGQSPGDNKFKENNVNYRLEADDADIIGKAFPDLFLGWNNTFSWKNFDVNIFLQGTFGADRLNLGRYIMVECVSDARMPTHKDGIFNYWTPDNQDTKVPNPFSSTINTRLETKQYLESADYVRLKNVSISYNIPRSKTKMFGDIKLTLSAQNLFTFTNYTGFDPEGSMDSRGTGGQVDTNVGIDGISYPVPRSFTAGLRLSF